MLPLLINKYFTSNLSNLGSLVRYYGAYMKVYHFTYIYNPSEEFEKALRPQLAGGGFFFTDPFQLYRIKRQSAVMMQYDIPFEQEETIKNIIKSTSGIAGPNTFCATSEVRPNNIVNISCYEGYYYLDDQDELIFKSCNNNLKIEFIQEKQQEKLARTIELSHNLYQNN